MEYVEIEVSGHLVQIDAHDAHLLQTQKWSVTRRKNKLYVVGCRRNRQPGESKNVYLHRLLTGADHGQIADHWDGNGLNNRRKNLRVTDCVGNARNSQAKTRPGKHSRFRGINLKKGKWIAKIRYGGKQHHLGSFWSEFSAAYAYDMASLEHHGIQGRRNFLPLVFDYNSS